MNPSSPAPDSQKQPSRALQSEESAAPLPPRGEVFDVALDENGHIKKSDHIKENPSPKKMASSWLFAGLAAVFCIYNVGAYVGRKSKTPLPVGPFTSPVEKLKPLRLQIAGQVQRPGAYTLPGGARLEDALAIAGGALPDADLSAFNLTDWVVDGSKIEIPVRQTVQTLVAPTPTPITPASEVVVTPPQQGASATSIEAPSATPEAPKATSGEAPPTNGQTMPVANPVANPATTGPDSNAPLPEASGKNSPAALEMLRRAPVDINISSAEQLSVLPGVGPKMAERIIAYRRENGGFKSVAELDSVIGIGEKRMATLQPLVRVK